MCVVAVACAQTCIGNVVTWLIDMYTYETSSAWCTTSNRGQLWRSRFLGLRAVREARRW
jgi:hypothetical protein